MKLPEAWLCLDCDEVFAVEGRQSCPGCGGRAVACVPISRWLNGKKWDEQSGLVTLAIEQERDREAEAAVDTIIGDPEKMRNDFAERQDTAMAAAQEETAEAQFRNLGNALQELTRGFVESFRDSFGEAYVRGALKAEMRKAKRRARKTKKGRR